MSVNFPFDTVTGEEYGPHEAKVHRKTITLWHLRGTPLGPLRAEAFIDRIEGAKTYARGYLSDADGHTVEADGVFIEPAWARDAGGQERSDSGIVTA